MQVLNVHSRIINQPKTAIADLIATLASSTDQVWPHPHWPRMKLDQGLKKGSKGGHGPIRYTVMEYIPGERVQFNFTRPTGFDGHHIFELFERNRQQTEVKHTIRMQTSGKATLSWLVGIRWLHDALIEDAFDKIENHFSPHQKQTPWNLWVRILRKILT